MATVSQTLEMAIAHHQAKRFDQADRMYQEVLQADPNQPDAIHFSGLIARHRGDQELALDRIGRSIELAPNNPVSHNNLAAVYLALHRSHEAANSCHRAIRLRPNYASAHANLGRALADQGQQEEAIAAYQEAVRLDPQYSEAFNNLGNLLQMREKFEEATACYQRAIAIRPDFAEAHVNWGKCLADQGKFAEAVAAYKQALKTSPDDLAVLLSLSGSLKELGRLDEAVAVSRRALEIEPNSHEPYNSLGCVLVDLGRLDEAQRCYRKALEIKPHCPHATHNLGAVQAVRGRHEQAARLFRDSLALDPDHHRSRIALAGIKRLTLDDLTEIEHTLRLLAARSVPPKSRSLLHFTLGKSYDDRSRWDQAFAHIEQGNRLENVTFDLEKFSQGIDARIEIFTAQRLAHPPARGRHSDLPVYIVGMPRSGTTLVEQILSCHGQFAAGGEIGLLRTIREAMPSSLENLESYPGGLPNIDRQTIGRLADAMIARLRQVDATAIRIADKMPGNFLHLGLVAMALPRARVIHCRRHPLDTCLSCYFQAFARRLGFAYDLEILGNYYRQYERIMAHWRDVLRPGMFFEVNYEELVENQEQVSRELVEFCGLDWDDACLKFHENKRAVQTASSWQVRQPMYTRSVGRWKHYDKHLGPLKEALGWSRRSHAAEPPVSSPLPDPSCASLDAFAVWESPPLFSQPEA